MRGVQIGVGCGNITGVGFPVGVAMKFRRKERQERRELLASMKEMNDGEKHADNGEVNGTRCKHSGRSSFVLRGGHRCLVECLNVLRARLANKLHI